MATRNRLLKLLDPAATFNGIDFVEVIESAPRELRVHFINTVALADTGPIARIDGGDSVPAVAVADIAAADWASDGEGRPLLSLHCLNDGDFSNYTLHLAASPLDLDFKTSAFSFKVFCPSD